MLCTFHQLWVALAHTHMNLNHLPGLWYPWPCLPNSDISRFLETCFIFRRCSENALGQRKHLWSECCEPNAFIYDALSCMPRLPQKFKYSVHVGGSSPLAHAQFHKIIDISTCFIWFVVSFLSDASLTMVNNWLDCFLCLSLIRFSSNLRISHLGSSAVLSWPKN